MPHAIWKGAISFGLVNIPIGLYSAEKRKEIDFHLLDRKDLAPVGYRKINKATGEEVRPDGVVRGYEYEKGRFVVVSDEDLKRANPKATQTIEIIDFVDLKEIHPVYFDKPYYLAPIARGEKGYALFREVLKRTGKVGVGRVVIHSKEYIGAVMPYGDLLELDLLRYSYELRDANDLDIPGEASKTGVSAKELEMAERLVESMSGPWQPDKYRDSYAEELKAYMDRKIEAGETVAAVETPAPEAAVPRGKVIDLMGLLKKSIEAAEAGKPRKKKAAG